MKKDPRMTPLTCAEINLDHLIFNLNAIESQVAPAKILPVVKADAYGHGALSVARHLVKTGTRFLAVALFEEAMDLRESGIDLPILIFGRLLPNQIQAAVKAGCRISVFGKEDIRRIEKAALSVPAYIHPNVETGMGRAGVLLDQEPDFFDRLLASKACIWEGLYSHFATADEADKTYARKQLDHFQHIINRVAKMDKGPTLRHMANSGAIYNLPESYFDAVRPGISLYGHRPSSATPPNFSLKQVMTFKTYVAHLRPLPAGQSISYGRRYITKTETRIAVLPVGYADGISRAFTNNGEVLIGGKHYPMVGTVTMDQTMVDVGKAPVRPGDEVLLWGSSAQGKIEALEVAERIGTIPYELTCGVSKRVKRVYIGNI
jgi:alanine racemase